MSAYNRINYSENEKVGLCLYIKESLPSLTGKRNAIFKCPCGRTFECSIDGVRYHNQKCKECSINDHSKRATRHGLSKSSEHSIWRGMINRCTNPNCERYPIYGGRGIRVCPEWLGKNGFIQFYQDMGPRPSKSHSIERINGNKDYSKENCKWATSKEQARNRKTSRVIEYNGESKTLAEWAEILNIGYATLSRRLDKWKDIQRAFTEPVNNKR